MDPTPDPLDRPAIPRGILDGGVVAIARRVDADRLDAIAGALADGGVRALEITLNEPQADALRAIEALATRASQHGLDIGAGTVLTTQAAERAVDVGASFLVMPHCDPELVAFACRRGVPALPGCATPTEVLAGWRAGAAAIKLFPASTLGPGFVRELRGPLPDIPVVPTGGVTAESAGAFIAAGATAVGMGGWLIGDGDPAGVRARSAAVVEAVARAREGRP